MELFDRESLRALSVGTRRDIVKLLGQRPHTASELAKVLHKHVTTVTEHLAVLESSRFVGRRPTTNKWVYYALTPKGEKLFKPALYSWTIVFALSLLSFGVGAWQLAGSEFAAADLAAKAAEGAPTAAAPAGAPLPIVPLVLVALGVIGFAYLLVRHRQDMLKN